MGRFLLLAVMTPFLLFSSFAMGLEERRGHAQAREFACGNDPYQQCMDALIRLCGNPARMSCAIKHQATLTKISRDAAK